MKIADVMTRTRMVDEKGILTRQWAQWLQEVADTKAREVKDTTASPTAPKMKKGEWIIFHCTNSSIATSYIVFYDGTHRYYWEIDSTDLY